jgi:hypothetical protein
LHIRNVPNLARKQKTQFCRFTTGKRHFRDTIIVCAHFILRGPTLAFAEIVHNDFGLWLAIQSVENKHIDLLRDQSSLQEENP